MQDLLDEEQSIGSQTEKGSEIPSEKVIVHDIRLSSSHKQSTHKNQGILNSSRSLSFSKPVKRKLTQETLLSQDKPSTKSLSRSNDEKKGDKFDILENQQILNIELPCNMETKEEIIRINTCSQKNFDASIQEDQRVIEMLGSNTPSGQKKPTEEMLSSNVQKKNKNISRSMKSSLSYIFDDEYFVEDQKQEYLKKQRYMNPELFHKLRDHEVEWSFSVFFEFLLYHVLFYMIIGPLIIIPMYNQKTLLVNLAFWGNKVQFYVQAVAYFLNAFNIITFFTSENSNIYPVEIIYMQVVIFLRAYIIACKYATLHPDKIELYRQFVLTGDLTANDYYFARWVFQKDITIYREAYNAMQRGEFDASLFYMSFFVEPRDKYLQEIEENVASLSQWHRHDEDEFQPERVFKQENSVFGYGILSYIIKTFSEQNPNGPLALMAVVLALIRGVLLLVYRYIANDQDSLSFTGIEIIQMIGIINNTTFGYFSSFVFLIFFTKDLQMKDYCQKQCLHILSPKRMSLGIKKTLPTINFLDPFTLKAWSTLRRVLLDYGKPYYLRIEAFITIYVLVAIVSLAVLLLWLFKAYELPQNIGVACGFESFFILFFLLIILIQGAKINSNFDKFQNVLVDYRVLFDDLIRLRNYYFMEGSKSTNVIRSRTIEKIKKKLTSDNKQLNEEDILTYLNDLNDGLDDCARELEQDSLNQPFLFFGIKITTVLVQNVLVGMATTTVAVVQYYLSKK